MANVVLAGPLLILLSSNTVSVSSSVCVCVCACVLACVSLSLSVTAVKMLNILSLRRVVQRCDERDGGAREGEREREGESSCLYQWLSSDFHTCGLHKCGWESTGVKTSILVLIHYNCYQFYICLVFVQSILIIISGGKRDEKLILPVNSSLSITLGLDEVSFPAL